MTPTKLKGANDCRFFIQQSGNKIQTVTVTNILVLSVDGSRWNKLVKVSANTIEKARHAKKVLNVVEIAGIQAVLLPTDRLQASLKLVAPSVYAQTFPIIANPYADKMPIPVIKERAGNKADGELPKAAIPAGKLSTPTPTMALTKLKTSLGIVAVPPLFETVTLGGDFDCTAPPRNSEMMLSIAAEDDVRG